MTELKACHGGKSQIAPWRTAVLCQDCKRRMVVPATNGQVFTEPPLKRVSRVWECAYKVTETQK